MSKRCLHSKLGWCALSIVASACGMAPSYGQSHEPYRFPFCAATTSSIHRSVEREHPESDRIFVREAAITGLLEVKMSRMAALRANSSQIRQFAQKVADDHARANRKLKQIAWSKDLEVCNEMDEKRAKLLLALQRYSGDDFDREYLTLQVDQHRRAVRLFQQHAQGGSDAELRDFAGAKLPALESHLREAALLADSR